MKTTYVRVRGKGQRPREREEEEKTTRKRIDVLHMRDKNAADGRALCRFHTVLQSFHERIGSVVLFGTIDKKSRTTFTDKIAVRTVQRERSWISTSNEANAVRHSFPRWNVQRASSRTLEPLHPSCDNISPLRGGGGIGCEAPSVRIVSVQSCRSTRRIRKTSSRVETSRTREASKGRKRRRDGKCTTTITTLRRRRIDDGDTRRPNHLVVVLWNNSSTENKTRQQHNKNRQKSVDGSSRS